MTQSITIDDLVRDCSVNARQAAFALEYLVDLNQTQAAIRAGYAAKGAHAHASRLVADVKVQKAIRMVRDARSVRCEITADDVLRQYKRLGWSDPRKMFNADGTAKGIHELDDDTAAAIAGFEVEEETTESARGKKTVVRTTKVKWADKRAAVDSVAKHLGMFAEVGSDNTVVVKVYAGGFDPSRDIKV